MADDTARTVVIRNRRGLHARAAAKFVRLAEEMGCAAAITVTKDGVSVCATSIMGLLMLSASTGTSIEISARGDKAQEAVAALSDLVERRFGEDE
jgi:phosphocarrier protein